MRNRYRLLVGVALLAPLLIGYWILPRVGLALIPLEEGRERWAEDFTVAAGERAIEPAIDCIREHSSWDRGRSGWAQVLRRLGQPAHEALLRAAAREQTAVGRAHLISVLQLEFSDYQMLSIWVNDVLTSCDRPSVARELDAELRRLNPEMPQVIDDNSDKLNVDFVLWWNKLSDAQKRGEPLPATDPAGAPTTTPRPD
jgi:hypothetical protein